MIFHSRRPVLVLCTVILLFVIAGGCTHPAAPERSRPVRNVILIIGDGTGYPAAGLLRGYARYAPESIYAGRDGICALEQAMSDGFNCLQFTEPHGVPVADSAASGTQLASGMPSIAGVIGGDHLGNPVETVLQTAKKHGKTTALVSDTRITHATPAAFAAHVPSRYMETSIAEQLIQRDTGPDILLAGGLRYFLPQSFNEPDSDTHRRLVEKWKLNPRTRSRRTDERDLLAEAETDGGYAVVLDRNALKTVRNPRVLGLFASSSMPDAITENRLRDDPARTWPALDEMAARALELASMNPNGFFLMVEAGQIDWAGHANDAGMLLHEMIRLDRVIDTVRTWAHDRSDTVIIITSDHDTGGFALAYTTLQQPPESVVLLGSLFAGRDYQPVNDFGDYGVLDKLFNQKMGYNELFGRFRRLDDEQRTPETLAAMVQDATGVVLTPDETARILQERPNPFMLDDEDDADVAMIPDLGDDQVFYTNSMNMLCGLLARRTGIDRNIAWACGTHTAAPVPLIVLGPDDILDRFSPVMHTTDTGMLLHEIVSGR
jgi:alkaline phosphatase